MRKSVRLDPALALRLGEAARVTGQSEADLVRAAVAAECDRLLGPRLDLALADVIASVSSGGGNSREIEKEFALLMEKKHGRRRVAPEMDPEKGAEY